MYLVAIVIAVCCLQFWGANNPFHRDDWFDRYISFLSTKQFLKRSTLFTLIAVVGLPTLIFVLFNCWVDREVGWFVSLILSTVVLLYCLGRGEFSENIYLYTQACLAGDWETALKKAHKLGAEVEGISVCDWLSLHEVTLEYASYRGFERLFAVIFWFALFGPAGAICYRVSQLYAERYASAEGSHWLWVLEWPAVRILGLSFAMTGNFVGCLHQWKVYCYCLKNDSSYVLKQFVMGALAVDDSQQQNCEVTRRELELLQNLFARTLWFWLAVLALMTFM